MSQAADKQSLIERHSSTQLGSQNSVKVYAVQKPSESIKKFSSKVINHIKVKSNKSIQTLYKANMNSQQENIINKPEKQEGNKIDIQENQISLKDKSNDGLNRLLKNGKIAILNKQKSLNDTFVEKVKQKDIIIESTEKIPEQAMTQIDNDSHTKVTQPVKVENDIKNTQKAIENSGNDNTEHKMQKIEQQISIQNQSKIQQINTSIKAIETTANRNEYHPKNVEEGHKLNEVIKLDQKNEQNQFLHNSQTIIVTTPKKQIKEIQMVENISRTVKVINSSKQEQTEQPIRRISFRVKTESNKKAVFEPKVHIEGPQFYLPKLTPGRKKLYTQFQPHGEEIADQIQYYKSNMISQARIKKIQLEKKLINLNKQIKDLKNPEKSVESKTTPKNSPKAKIKIMTEISDNMEANIKALNLVKKLKHERQKRQKNKVETFKKYHQQFQQSLFYLSQKKYEKQQRSIQRKKIQILQRMIEQQKRKSREKQMKKLSANFIRQVRAQQSRVRQQFKFESERQYKHSLSKNQLNPELTHKKKLLQNIRNLSREQSKQIEQVLQIN